MKLPTAGEKRKLVRLLAAYILKDGAHIAVQQKAYDAWMAYFAGLESRYPHVAFRGHETLGSLTAAAKREAGRKLFRGAGATF